jgi:hypothetical protein
VNSSIFELSLALAMDEDRCSVPMIRQQPRLPFPFGERDLEAERRLFGDRRSAFSFEHLASEFEAADEGNDSGIGELISLLYKLSFCDPLSSYYI